MKNKLFKMFLSFSYGSWIGLFLGLFSTIITTRILAPEDFGKASMYTLALNICIIITIFGTDQSFVRFFYEEKKENRGGLLYNCLKLPMLSTIALSTLIILFHNKISLFLFGDTSLMLTLLLVLGVFAQLLYRYGRLVIRMQQRGNLYSVLEILQKLFNLLILVLLFMLTGASYKIVIYSTLVTTVSLTFIAVISGKDFWNIRNFFKKNLTHSKSEIFKFGSPFVLTIFITWLFQAFDKIALRLWGDFEELGLYSAAFNIVALVVVLQNTFSAFWTPVSYEKFEKSPNEKEFFEKISQIVSFAMFSVAIISIAGKDVIVLLLGSDFKEAAIIMPFLVFMPVLYTLSETTVIGINFFKKTRWHILIAGVACVVNIFGNWLLVPDFGAIGASISTAIAYLIFFSLRTHISLKFYKVNYNLKKIYFMIAIVSFYSLFSIKVNSFYVNILLGIAALLILTVVYRKDLIMTIRGYKINK